LSFESLCANVNKTTNTPLRVFLCDRYIDSGQYAAISNRCHALHIHYSPRVRQTSSIGSKSAWTEQQLTTAEIGAARRDTAGEGQEVTSCG
jgi:hypothetical protein